MKKFLMGAFVIGLLVFANGCDDDNDDGNDHEMKPVDLTLVTDGLVSPLVLMESPDNSGRLFVADQPGQVYIIKDGERLATPFLDVSGKIVPINTAEGDERGLLGLAFHPNFGNNGKFYVYYSAPLHGDAPAGWNHTSHIAEYTATVGSDQAEVASERILLTIDKPQANHNGGMLAFGPDGYLYISVGDGGGGNDNGEGHVDDWYAGNEGGNGQDKEQNLMGDILRIDVNTGDPYGIPADNPFVGEAGGRDEVYAYGFRNPYRFAFGPGGQLIAADAGQELYEEIDVVEKGGNYGWNVKEGRHCFSTADPENPPASCPDTDDEGNPLIDPVIEFKNSRAFSDGLGNVSIGGYVYQGDEIDWLEGKYIFGVLTQDPESADGAVFYADRTGNDWPYEKLDINNMSEPLGYILGFGQDKAGEVYVLINSGGSATGGKVFKLTIED